MGHQRDEIAAGCRETGANVRLGNGVAAALDAQPHPRDVLFRAGEAAEPDLNIVGRCSVAKPAGDRGATEGGFEGVALSRGDRFVEAPEALAPRHRVGLFRGAARLGHPLSSEPGVAAGWNDCHGLGICDALCDNAGITAPCSADAYNPCCTPYDPDGSPGNDCHDGYDNDGDGQTDETGSPADGLCRHGTGCNPNGGHPNHTHKYESGVQFMFLGDVHYCSYLVDRGDDWRAKMKVRATTVVDGFALQTGHASYDALSPKHKIRMVSAKCWVLPTVAAARDCKDYGGSSCSPFNGAPHSYPYGGASNASEHYIDGVRQDQDLAHSVSVGLTNPVNLSQVLMAPAKGEQLIGTESPDVLGNTVGAYSVVKASDTFSTFGADASNHEFGHSLGLGHCTAEVSPIDDRCTTMGDSGSTGGGACVFNGPCDAPLNSLRFSAASAVIVYNNARAGTALPYHFGELP